MLSGNDSHEYLWIQIKIRYATDIPQPFYFKWRLEVNKGFYIGGNLQHSAGVENNLICIEKK